MTDVERPGAADPGSVSENAAGGRLKETVADRSVTTLDEAAARRLTERIRLLASSLAEQVDKIIGLIVEARTGRADAALGYQSWTAYVETEFADALPRLVRSQRRDVVAQLTARGMSTRAIAPVVRSSQGTVARDLRRGADAPPEFDPHAMPYALVIVDEDEPVAPRRRERSPRHRQAVRRNRVGLDRAGAGLTGLLGDLRADEPGATP